MNARQKAKKYKKEYQRLKELNNPIQKIPITEIRCERKNFRYAFDNIYPHQILKKDETNKVILLKKAKRELARKFAKYIEENMKVTQYNDSRFYFPNEYEATVYIGFEYGQEEKQNF